MKKRNIGSIITLLVTAMFLTGFTAPDKQADFRKIMKKYRREEGFFTLSIPTSIIKILVPKDETEAKELLKDIKKIRLLVYDEGTTSSPIVISCKNDLEVLFKYGTYVDLLTINDDSETVKIRAIPDGDNLKELTIFVYNEGQLVVVNFVGTTDLNKMIQLVNNTKNLKSGEPLLEL